MLKPIRPDLRRAAAPFIILAVLSLFITAEAAAQAEDGEFTPPAPPPQVNPAPPDDEASPDDQAGQVEDDTVVPPDTVTPPLENEVPATPPGISRDEIEEILAEGIQRLMHPEDGLPAEWNRREGRLRDQLAAIRADLAAVSTPAPHTGDRREAVASLVMLVTALILLVATVATLVFIALDQRRRIASPVERIGRRLERLEAVPRNGPPQAPEGVSPKPVPSADESNTAWQEARKNVGKALDDLRSLAAGMVPAGEALTREMSALREATRLFTAERTAMEQARNTENETLRKRESEINELRTRLREQAEAPSISDSFWPPSLRDGGKLGAWKDRLAKELLDGSPDARRLGAALLDWAALTAADAPPGREAAGALSQLGQRLFRYWDSISIPDDEARIEAIQAWSAALRADIEKSLPHLQISPVYPDDAFDHDRMEAVESLSGSRITVKRPLSWIILQRTPEAERVLHRAQVITA